jgi:ribosomal-protein-alanine N-acetyltransferase
VNIFLAALDYQDRELIRGWRNHYDVWKWCRQNGPISDFEQELWFQRQANDKTVQMYKVMATGSEFNEPVGVCGLTSIDMVNRRAEFSLYIAPHLHRHGLGKGALHCLLHHGFNHMGLHVIWGETFDGNPAARMFEKMGFVKEGTRRDFYFRDGRFIDAHIYSIKGDEWNTAKRLYLPLNS